MNSRRDAWRFGPILAVPVFAVVAVMNTGGYRYGASDQAFYIPAINARLDGTLFPRDRALLEAEGRLMLFDEAMAWLIATTGVRLPAILFAAFLAGLLSLGIAIAVTGASFYRLRWTTVVLMLALTLRHRIPRTGVNTLEGYLHPRMLAFAAGVGAVAALLRQRLWTAIACVAVAAVIHPTTAIWFAVLIGIAILVDVPQMRTGMIVAAAAAVLAGVWMVSFGPLHDRLVTMDATWLEAVEGKDYLFPAEWPIADWMLNIGYLALVAGLHAARRRAGIVQSGEQGLVAGAFVLFAIFLLSLPLTMMRIALAVQLQVPRMFWLLDFLATLLVVWAVAEGPRPHARRVMLTALILAGVSLGRAIYVMQFEHPDRPLLQRELVSDDWTDAMRAVQRLPVTTHVLADPGHSWKYGTSVRVAAARDVYLEDVKDSAIAMYARAVAERVVTRRRDLPDFARLTEEEAKALARKYQLDVLVIDRAMKLRELYRNDRFRIYSLH